MGKKNKETKGKKPIEMYSLNTMKQVRESLARAEDLKVTTEVMTAAIWFAQKYPTMSMSRILLLAEGEWIK